MPKDTEKYNNESHFTYSDYRQKVNKKPNRDIIVFISVFIIGVLILLGFAKILSPNVDVGISGPEDEYAYEDEETSSVIDERLKNIQQEDSNNGNDDEMFSPELYEKVILPKQVRKTVGEMEAEMQNEKEQQEKAELKKQHEEHENKPEPKETVQNTSSAPQANHSEPKPVQQITNAKVVVGYYATEKQAEVAKTIIQDAGLGVVPMVKNMNGYYTLQVGSYSSKDKAQQAANNLLKSNFPARVIVE